jgi:tripartite-type tricarboxylate transporter receptor subunit TctC
MQEVARADDQHTVILGHIGTLAVNPYIFPKLPYDPNKDFQPVSLLAKVPSLYVVHPDLPVKNIEGVRGLCAPTRASSAMARPATAAPAIWRSNT